MPGRRRDPPARRSAAHLNSSVGGPRPQAGPPLASPADAGPCPGPGVTFA